MTTSTTTFAELSLVEPLLAVLTQQGYTSPTPIQAQAIPHVLAGKDLLGIAQTGTGKTAAFALPMLQRLSAHAINRKPMTCRALILSPTRELASQIAESFRVYGGGLKMSVLTVFGGVGHVPQARALRAGVDILVATPGRLLDHMREGNIRFDHTEIFVLDEADQMLDMGFIRDIKKLVAGLPRKRQSLFFSATMPDEIAKLAGELLTNPTRVEVTPVATTVERIAQRVEFMNPGEKNAALAEILRKPEFTRALVFTRTKHGADKVVRYLEAAGIPGAAIHGNKSQGQRERALGEFKAGRVKVLVATDIAARGIDIDAVSHVINYHLPNIPESYVHRIGRTARAGRRVSRSRSVTRKSAPICVTSSVSSASRSTPSIAVARSSPVRRRRVRKTRSIVRAMTIAVRTSPARTMARASPDVPPAMAAVPVSRRVAESPAAEIRTIAAESRRAPALPRVMMTVAAASPTRASPRRGRRCRPSPIARRPRPHGVTETWVACQ